MLLVGLMTLSVIEVRSNIIKLIFCCPVHEVGTKVVESLGVRRVYSAMDGWTLFTRKYKKTLFMITPYTNKPLLF